MSYLFSYVSVLQGWQSWVRWLPHTESPPVYCHFWLRTKGLGTHRVTLEHSDCVELLAY